MKNTYKVNRKAVKKTAERVYDNGSTVINRNDLEEIFIELKESEDKRIRKSIICALKRYYIADTVFDGFSREDMITYLEKEDEQKHEK